MDSVATLCQILLHQWQELTAVARLRVTKEMKYDVYMVG
jgi:hypothetical protein